MHITKQETAMSSEETEMALRQQRLFHKTALRHQEIHHEAAIRSLEAKYRRALKDIHEEAKLSLTALARGKPHVVEDKLDRIASMTEQLISDSLVAETKRKMKEANRVRDYLINSSLDAHDKTGDSNVR
jgi:hypothetical protein